MRFLSKLVDSKAKMAEKVESEQDTEMANTANVPRQRKSAVCQGPFIDTQWPSNGRVKRDSRDSRDSRGSISSHDSDANALQFSLEIKRMSSETASASISIASSSASSTSSAPIVDELDELLLAIHGHITESDARRNCIRAYEESYLDSKALVRQMAQELVMKIRAHEARLLEEIETRHETMYKKLGLKNDKEKLDNHIQHMESMHSEGEAIISDSAQLGQTPDLNPHYGTVLEKLREVVKEAESMPGADVKILPLCVSPVRCNTAFACLLDACNQQNAGSHGYWRRQNSMPHKPLSHYRSQANSLQVSNSVAGNMHQLATEGMGGVGRRLSLQHHSYRPRTNSFLHPFSNANSLTNAHCFPHGNDNCSGGKMTLVWANTSEGAQEGQINCPNDLCFLPNGNLVVSDRDNHRLQIFTKHGKYVRSIADGKIKPRRIAITRDGHIALTDSKDNMIKVYSAEGNLISSWGKKRFKQLFKAPCGIACTRKGQFVISDLERHTVTLHAPDGKLLRHLGAGGGDSTASGVEFHSPAYISVCPLTQRIVVADNWTHAVHVFDESGDFLRNAEHPDAEAELKYPNGVACGRDGAVHVALWGTHAVASLAPTAAPAPGASTKLPGTLLTRGEHGIYHPAGIALHDNLLAISEYSDAHSALRVYSMNS